MKTKHYFLFLFICMITATVSCSEEKAVLPEGAEQEAQPVTKSFDINQATLSFSPYRNFNYGSTYCPGHIICSGGHCMYCGYPRGPIDYHTVNSSFSVYSENHYGDWFSYYFGSLYVNYFLPFERFSFSNWTGSNDRMLIPTYFFIDVNSNERGVFRLQTDFLMRFDIYNAETFVRGYETIIIHMDNLHAWRLDYDANGENPEDPYKLKQFITDIAQTSINLDYCTQFHLNIPINTEAQSADEEKRLLRNFMYDLYAHIQYTIGYDLNFTYPFSLYINDKFFNDALYAR